MRIISQNRSINIPYNMVTITLKDEEKNNHLTGRIEIVAWSVCNSNIYRLGIYSTVGQAEYIMDEIALVMAEAENNHYAYQMPKDEGKKYIK